MNELVAVSPATQRLARRRFARRQARAAVRGLILAAGFAWLITSGLLAVPLAAKSVLLTLTGLFALTRLMRGLWAARVYRHLAYGWRRRHLPAQLPAPTSPDRQAVLVLTERDEPLIQRAREHGLALVDRMERLRTVLADAELSAGLRRPVAEELARLEEELEALMSLLGEVARPDRRSEQDVFGRLAARLEVASGVPDGLYAS